MGDGVSFEFTIGSGQVRAKGSVSSSCQGGSTAVLKRCLLDASVALAPFNLRYVHAAGGIGIGSVGTSVATETCGHVRGAKFKKTVCEYWIWVM